MRNGTQKLKVFLGTKYLENNKGRQLIEDISELLVERGFETSCILRDVEKWGEVILPPKELMSKTFETIDKSDIVLIELSIKGVGLGIEAGYAYGKKPIITIANSNVVISKTLSGISTATFQYSNLDDLKRFFDNLRDCISLL